MKNFRRGLRDIVLLGAFMAFSAGCASSQPSISGQGADPQLEPASLQQSTPTFTPTIPVESKTPFQAQASIDASIGLTYAPQTSQASRTPISIPSPTPSPAPSDPTCHYCGLNRFWLRYNDPAAFEACGSAYCCTASCPSDAVVHEGPYFTQCSFTEDEHAVLFCKSGCGLTSLKMLFDAQEYNVGLFDLWTDLGCTRPKGCDIGRIKKYLEEHNLYGGEFSVWHRGSLEEAIRNGNPMLLATKIERYRLEGFLPWGNHYVAVVGFSDDFVIIRDGGVINQLLYPGSPADSGNNLVLTWPTFYSFGQDDGYGTLYVILPPPKP
jgi:hypothetical protein